MSLLRWGTSMKRIFIAAALLMGTVLPANAEVIFLGGFNVISAASCFFTKVGEKRVVRYRPPAQAGNPVSGGFALLYPGGSYTIEFAGAHPALNTFQAVSSVESGSFGFEVYPTRIKFTARTPATVLAGTRSIFMRGVIEEPFGEKFAPGACVVGFEAALVRE
jgi:hypothetical protein